MRTRPDRFLAFAVIALVAGCGAPHSGMLARDTPAGPNLEGDYDSTLGMALGRQLLRSDPARAEQVFLKLLARSPQNAAALNDLGIARDVLGRHKDAQSAYRAALAVSPGLRATSINLALSLALDGDAAGAARAAQRVSNAPAGTAAERADLAAVAALAEAPASGNVLAGN